MIVLHGLFVVTNWSTTSGWLNAIINWLAIAGYELLVLLFSRLSPRWLSVPSAAILLIPLFAASVVFPLSHVFKPGVDENIPLADHFFYEGRSVGEYWRRQRRRRPPSSITVHPLPRFYVTNSNPFPSTTGVQFKRSLCDRISGEKGLSSAMPALAHSILRKRRQASPLP